MKLLNKCSAVNSKYFVLTRQHCLHIFLRNISKITIADDKTKIIQNSVGGFRKIIQMKVQLKRNCNIILQSVKKKEQQQQKKPQKTTVDEKFSKKFLKHS